MYVYRKKVLILLESSFAKNRAHHSRVDERGETWCACAPASFRNGINPRKLRPRGIVFAKSISLRTIAFSAFPSRKRGQVGFSTLKISSRLILLPNSFLCIDVIIFAFSSAIERRLCWSNSTNRWGSRIVGKWMLRRKYDGLEYARSETRYARERWGIGRKESGVEGSRIFGKAVYVTLVHSHFRVSRWPASDKRIGKQTFRQYRSAARSSPLFLPMEPAQPLSLYRRGDLETTRPYLRYS